MGWISVALHVWAIACCATCAAQLLLTLQSCDEPLLHSGLVNTTLLVGSVSDCEVNVTLGSDSRILLIGNTSNITFHITFTNASVEFTSVPNNASCGDSGVAGVGVVTACRSTSHSNLTVVFRKSYLSADDDAAPIVLGVDTRLFQAVQHVVLQGSVVYLTGLHVHYSGNILCFGPNIASGNFTTHAVNSVFQCVAKIPQLCTMWTALDGASNSPAAFTLRLVSSAVLNSTGVMDHQHRTSTQSTSNVSFDILVESSIIQSTIVLYSGQAIFSHSCVIFGGSCPNIPNSRLVVTNSSVELAGSSYLLDISSMYGSLGTSTLIIDGGSTILLQGTTITYISPFSLQGTLLTRCDSASIRIVMPPRARTAADLFSFSHFVPASAPTASVSFIMSNSNWSCKVLNVSRFGLAKLSTPTSVANLSFDFVLNHSAIDVVIPTAATLATIVVLKCDHVTFCYNIQSASIAITSSSISATGDGELHVTTVSSSVVHSKIALDNVSFTIQPGSAMDAALIAVSVGGVRSAAPESISISLSRACTFTHRGHGTVSVLLWDEAAVMPLYQSVSVVNSTFAFPLLSTIASSLATLHSVSIVTHHASLGANWNGTGTITMDSVLIRGSVGFNSSLQLLRCQLPNVSVLVTNVTFADPVSGAGAMMEFSNWSPMVNDVTATVVVDRVNIAFYAAADDSSAALPRLFGFGWNASNVSLVLSVVNSSINVTASADRCRVTSGSANRSLLLVLWVPHTVGSSGPSYKVSIVVSRLLVNVSYQAASSPLFQSQLCLVTVAEYSGSSLITTPATHFSQPDTMSFFNATFNALVINDRVQLFAAELAAPFVSTAAVAISRLVLIEDVDRPGCMNPSTPLALRGLVDWHLGPSTISASVFLKDSELTLKPILCLSVIPRYASVVTQEALALNPTNVFVDVHNTSIYQMQLLHAKRAAAAQAPHVHVTIANRSVLYAPGLIVTCEVLSVSSLNLEISSSHVEHRTVMAVTAFAAVPQDYGNRSSTVVITLTVTSSVVFARLLSYTPQAPTTVLRMAARNSRLGHEKHLEVAGEEIDLGFLQIIVRDFFIDDTYVNTGGAPFFSVVSTACTLTSFRIALRNSTVSGPLLDAANSTATMSSSLSIEASSVLTQSFAQQRYVFFPVILLRELRSSNFTLLVDVANSVLNISALVLVSPTAFETTAATLSLGSVTVTSSAIWVELGYTTAGISVPYAGVFVVGPVALSATAGRLNASVVEVILLNTTVAAGAKTGSSQFHLVSVFATAALHVSRGVFCHVAHGAIVSGGLAQISAALLFIETLNVTTRSVFLNFSGGVLVQLLSSSGAVASLLLNVRGGSVVAQRLVDTVGGGDIIGAAEATVSDATAIFDEGVRTAGSAGAVFAISNSSVWFVNALLRAAMTSGTPAATGAIVLVATNSTVVAYTSPSTSALSAAVMLVTSVSGTASSNITLYFCKAVSNRSAFSSPALAFSSAPVAVRIYSSSVAGWVSLVQSSRVQSVTLHCVTWGGRPLALSSSVAQLVTSSVFVSAPPAVLVEPCRAVTHSDTASVPASPTRSSHSKSSTLDSVRLSATVSSTQRIALSNTTQMQRTFSISQSLPLLTSATATRMFEPPRPREGTLPSPPLKVSVPTSAAVVALSVVGGLLQGVNPIFLQRTSLSRSFADGDCTFSLELLDSPTTLRIPAGADDTDDIVTAARGAVVGNVLLWIACATGLLCTGTIVVVCRRRRGILDALGRGVQEASLPGSGIVVVTLLLQSTVAASVFLLTTAEANSIVCGVFGLLVCCALVATGVLRAARSVPCHCVGTTPRSDGAVTCASIVNAVAAPQFVWIPHDSTDAWVYWRRWGALFRSYRGPRLWFSTVELGSPLLCGLISGMSEAMGCSASLWLLLVVSVAEVAAATTRPFTSVFDDVNFAVNACLALLCSALSLAGAGDASVTVATVQLALSAAMQFTGWAVAARLLASQLRRASTLVPAMPSVDGGRNRRRQSNDVNAASKQTLDGVAIGESANEGAHQLYVTARSSDALACLIRIVAKRQRSKNMVEE